MRWRAGERDTPASYCGDDRHYTVSGTRINSEHLRHAELARSAGFTGRCNGRPLPRCAVSSARTRYLASRPSTGA